MTARPSTPARRPDTSVHPMDMDNRRLTQIRQESLHRMMGVAALMIGAHLLAVLLMLCL